MKDYSGSCCVELWRDHEEGMWLFKIWLHFFFFCFVFVIEFALTFFIVIHFIILKGAPGRSVIVLFIVNGVGHGVCFVIYKAWSEKRISAVQKMCHYLEQGLRVTGRNLDQGFGARSVCM